MGPVNSVHKQIFRAAARVRKTMVHARALHKSDGCHEWQHVAAVEMQFFSGTCPHVAQRRGLC